MDNQVTYETVVELLPAYAVGALEPDEMLAVDTYLQRHHALLARVEQLDLATAQLAQAAPFAPMPATAKKNLMAQVRAEAAASPHTLALPSLTDSAPAPTVRNPLFGARLPEPAPERTPDGRLERGLALGRTQPLRAFPPVAPVRTRKFNFGWAAAAAIAAAALFIIWIDIGAQRQLAQLQIELANQNTTITTLSEQLQVKDEQLEQNNLQLAFFAAPTDIVTLAGTDIAPAAGGVFYQHNERGLLVLHGLAALPPDQRYQLWLIPADADPISGGLLAMQPTDVTLQAIVLPANAFAYNAIGISIEPALGSETPTADKIVIFGSKV